MRCTITSIKKLDIKQLRVNNNLISSSEIHIAQNAIVFGDRLLTVPNFLISGILIFSFRIILL